MEWDWICTARRRIVDVEHVVVVVDVEHVVVVVDVEHAVVVVGDALSPSMADFEHRQRQHRQHKWTRKMAKAITEKTFHFKTNF